jgi:NADH-quinone oxidoreductase subunit J
VNVEIPATATQVLAQAAEAGSNTGETVLFWLVGPIAVLAALGLVISRKAVHGAMFVAVTMICLAILYIALEAPFLGVVQIVVYTGAIMMLFLFVIMLVGVDASDSRVETIRGQRVAAVLAGIGLGILLVAVVGNALVPQPTGLAEATPDGNVPGIADLIFSRYVWAFEVTSALLITAALGAMVLTHRERLFRRASQRELSEARFRAGGIAASPLPSPGVYARHNAIDTPALLPDGTPSELSISNVIVARGAVRATEEDALDVSRLERQVDELTAEQPDAGEEERP